MAKTYIPGAVTVADSAHKYLSRWQAKLSASASPEQVTALVNLIACLAAFLLDWHKAPPNP